MGRRDTIKLKMAMDRVVMLSDLYLSAMMDFEPDNSHEELLFEHMVAFQRRLEKIIFLDESKKITITMSSVEAISFSQFWQLWCVTYKMKLPIYEAEIIRCINAEINKANVTSKKQLHAAR